MVRRLSLNEQLNEFYSANGKMFKTHWEAVKFMNGKGYFVSRNAWRNLAGKKAYLTKIKDFFFDKAGNKTIIPLGWLVTLGGDPLAFHELTLSHKDAD